MIFDETAPIWPSILLAVILSGDVILSIRPVKFMVKSWVVVYLFSNLGLVSWRWFRGHLGDKG